MQLKIVRISLVIVVVGIILGLNYTRNRKLNFNNIISSTEIKELNFKKFPQEYKCVTKKEEIDKLVKYINSLNIKQKKMLQEVPKGFIYTMEIKGNANTPTQHLSFLNFRVISSVSVQDKIVNTQYDLSEDNIKNLGILYDEIKP